MRRFIAPLIAGGALLVGGCGAETTTNYENDITAEQLSKASNMFRTVAPGEAVLLQSETDITVIEDITSATKLINVQYPHGAKDDKAPVIGNNPQRIVGKISVYDNVTLNNDWACDTVRIDMEGFSETDVYLGALALSNNKNDFVLVSWPLNEDNEPSDFAQVCFDNGDEAKNGIVLAVLPGQ